MNAKEMFEQLGYEFKKEYTMDGVNDTYRYNKCSRPNDSVIFYLDGKQIIIYQTFNTIHVNELQAIIQQCKELGWLDEEQREETNLDHYKDEILENCLDSLAVVKGRPKLCHKTNCNDCDFKLIQKGCHNKVKDWLKQPHIKPTYKLTKFEKELLECYSDVYSFKVFNSLNGMKEKGYFKGIDDNEIIGDILAKCEVTE
nr:MAG TPA: hypothetical protein [Caudoviricetes sp.]